MSDESTFGVLIANWNGEAFIERCLGSVLAAVRRSGLAMEIVVTDDASDDRSAAVVPRTFPAVRLLQWHRNIGYARSVRRGLRAMTADWVFLLNNDLALQVDYCERLIATLAAWERGRLARLTRDSELETRNTKLGTRNSELETPNAPLFAIGARTRDWETRADNHGGQRAAWRGGMIVQEPFEAETDAPADFFQAGGCLVHRRSFLELGGMSSLYHPGYWEDYDLAWRARRRGWAILYEPRAVAYHAGKGSMTRLLGRRGVSLLVRRNHLLFNWVNLHDGALLRRHLLSLAGLVWRDAWQRGRHARILISGPRLPNDADVAPWGRAFLAALRRLPRALRTRRRRLAQGGRPDRELLKIP
jgi:GT2 family glycosyltransferase